jgi:hypothetical protein
MMIKRWPPHIPHLPHRKITIYGWSTRPDLVDAAWLAQLLECRLLAGSFILPAEVKAVRDVIRYRAKIAQQRVS